jgi:RNA polymerase sigma-70 factor (ECF subfamily)
VSWAPGKVERGQLFTPSRQVDATAEKSSVTSSPRRPRVTHEDVDPAGALFVGPLRDRAVPAVSDSIDRARAGDARELEAIARRELPRVQRLLRRLLGPRADMEDLVQNVFVEMCKALPTFRGESSISTFVGGIAVQIARRAMRPTAWVRFRAPMPGQAPPGPDRTDDNAVAAEQLRRVDLALAKISPDKRIAFVLWAVDGKDVDTIAKMMGASVAATRSRIHYAQRELKALAAADPYLVDLVGGQDAG